MAININSLHWAAGFLEGEGSFYSVNRSPCVVASQVQAEPLERIMALFGGKYAIHKSPSHKNKQPIHEWRIFGIRAVGIMMTLYSMMSPRRKEQIKKTLDYWRTQSIGLMSRYNPDCKRGHRRWGRHSYYIKSGENKTGRRCLECHRLRRAGLLDIGGAKSQT